MFDTMAMKMELGRLLDLAIGKPEMGAVNFNVLHSFLQGLLGHLALTNLEVKVNIDKMGGDGEPNTRLECKTCPTSTTESKVKQSAGIFQPGGAVEKRIHDLENKMTLLDSFSETDEILNWARGRERSLSKVSDLWNFMNFQKRIEASEDGIKKVGSLVDEILLQMQNRMNEVDHVKEQVRTLSEKINTLAGSKKMDEVVDELGKIKSTMSSMPVKKDLLTFVKWPDLQSALETGNVRRSSEVSEEKFQTTASGADRTVQERERSEIDQSQHPSEFVVTRLGELGCLPQAHSVLKEDVENLKQQLESKADRKDLEDFAPREDLIKQLEELKSALDDLKKWRKDIDSDRSTIARMKSNIDDMIKDIERLQTRTKFLTEEQAQKQSLIDILFARTEKLEELKADKGDIDSKLAYKADKSELENFVSRERFDTDVDRIDGALKELIDQVKTSDDNLNRMISKLLNTVEEKLSRREFIEFKERLDSRLKALSSKIKELPVMDDDPAAAFKKAMLQFNCLSCDRPVYFSGNGPIQGYSAFSPNKSGRPYTTYDLEQLRILQKANLKPDSADILMPRSCGGSHTSGIPTKRITAKLMAEVDIQGQDGKLYKGRIDKNQEYRAFRKVKPKSAHGSRTPNLLAPGEVDFNQKRPKTALARSPTMAHFESEQFRGRVPSPDLDSDHYEDVRYEDLPI